MAVPPHTAGAAPAGAWTTTIAREEPLVGKVYDGRRHRFAGPDDVFAAIAEADFVLLGEKHDNPYHHALQARALREMLARGKKPAVAFEMLDTDQRPAMDAYLAKKDASAEGFGAAVDWEKRGWPTYAWYAPIVKIALDAHLPIVATNLPRAELRAIVHDGKLDPARARELGVDKPLSDVQAVEVREEMRETHCGQLPEEMLDPMALAQRARDGALGAALIAAAHGGPVVLIAGNGHARTDRGVPAYLYAHAATGARVVSVSFSEVEHGEKEPGPSPYDYVWFTPRATDEDPCAKMMHQPR